MRPDDRYYTESHEWALLDGDVATIGISDFALEQLGEIVFLDLPTVGQTVNRGEAFGEIESVKAVSDLQSPVAGEVIEVNDALSDDQSCLQDDPFSEGWMIRVRLTAESPSDGLLNAADYEALVQAV